MFLSVTVFAEEGAPDPALVMHAIHRGVVFLDALPTVNIPEGEEEQEVEPYFNPPERSRERVGEEQVTVRYRMVAQERPVYEWTTKEVLVRRDDSSETEGGMVKKTVRVKGKQIGTKTVQVPKSDPNGPLTRTTKRPIYKRTGPDRWRLGQVAANCMAALVLLRQEEGVVPERVEEMLYELSDMLDTFGPPETTYDLAWMIVLFSESGDQAYHEKVPALIQTLVNAQLREGTARGLWGPVAVDPEEIALRMGETARLTEEFDAMKEKVGESGSRTEMKKLNALQSDLVSANEALKRVAGSYLEPNPKNAQTLVEMENGESLSRSTPDEYIFNQRTADLEHTWVALYALRVAREHKLLPGSVTRVSEAPGRGGAREEKVSVVQSLHAAGRAILSRQHQSGAFPEMNVQQPVTAFDRIPGVPGVPVEKKAFDPFPPELTLVSTAQGLSSLDQLRHILGLQAMRPYAGAMMRAKALLDQNIDEILNGGFDKLGDHSMGLFAFYLALRDTGPEMEAAPRDLLAVAIRHLLELQGSKGHWQNPFSNDVWIPTVWRARSFANPGVPQSLHGEGMSRPFTRLPVGEDGKTWDWRFRKTYVDAYPLMSTAAALLTLQAFEHELMPASPVSSLQVQQP